MCIRDRVAAAAESARDQPSPLFAAAAAARDAVAGGAPLFPAAALAALLDPARADLAAAACDAAPGRVAGDPNEAGAAALAALRADRVAWFAPARLLRACVEACAQAAARLAARPGGAGDARDRSASRSAALLYVAAGRARPTLASLARSEASRGSGAGAAAAAKLGKLLAFDFGTPRGRAAARKNAYALLAKHDYAMAAACFLLAEPPFVLDAARVALDKLRDPDLALALARLADDRANPDAGDALRCGLWARRVLRKLLLPAFLRDGDHALAAAARVWLGRVRGARAALVALADESAPLAPAARRPRALDHFRRTHAAFAAPALLARLGARGAPAARRAALAAATAAALRATPEAALRVLAADDGAGDDAERVFVARVEAAKRPAAAPAAPAPAAPAPAAAPSMLDGFDAAPQQRRAPPSMLDGFDAAPQRPPAAAPSMLDGFDAAPQQRKAPPSMLDGFDAAPQRRAPPAETAPEDAPTEAASSGDDDSPEAPPPPRERAREVALEAAAARLAARARACARQVGGDDVKARLAALKSEVKELQATHGLASTELNEAALATLASEPGPRPATACSIVHAATSHTPKDLSLIHI